MGKRVDEVFGMSTEILPDSYVDRDDLDETIAVFLGRPTHVAIRGSSKTGKSWLRQKVLPDAIVVQCRLGKTVEDIYREALGQLGVRLTLTTTSSRAISGTVEAESDFGVGLIAKVKVKLGLTGSVTHGSEFQVLRENISSLSFICDLLKESGKRLVIDDFHYLSRAERRHFAYDMKAMWDLKLYIVVVGVWNDTNLLLDLNPELSGRVHEESIEWREPQLREILEKGSSALNLAMSPAVVSELVGLSYKNAGILQRVTLSALDNARIREKKSSLQRIDDIEHVRTAAMQYAEELNTVYQTFARRVSTGIRKRPNATGIYAHALAVVLEASDKDLTDGVPTNTIFIKAREREPRIQQGNLKTALGNIEQLQVDEDGRGLVLTFADGAARIVDKQLLLYRRFATVPWPWDDMIAQANAAGEDYRTTVAIEDDEQ